MRARLTRSRQRLALRVGPDHEAGVGKQALVVLCPCVQQELPPGVRVGPVESSVSWAWAAGAKEVELGAPGEAWESEVRWE